MTLVLQKKSEQTVLRRSWVRTVRDWPLGFFAALQFLTILPPLIRRSLTAEELGRAVGWFALVGVLLGTFLAGVDRGLGLLFPRGVTAALLLTAWVQFTGALHLDGFLDTCDGLFGGHTPEARLRIMRDERVGAFAVIGGVLLLLVKYCSLQALTSRTVALVVAPTVARGAIALAVVAFPYARLEGTGRCMKDHAGWRQVSFSGLTVFLIALLAGPWVGFAILALAGVTFAGVALFVLSRLPGFTGDVYGALCEILEVVTLLIFVAGERS